MNTQEEKENALYSVCELVNTKGEKVIKTLSKELATHWCVNVLYTGKHLDCLKYMQNDN